MSWTGRIPPRLRSGWTAAAAIAAVVFLLWLPDLNLPLGDSDDGRILARYGLQARNYWELGPSESDFGARFAPYIRADFGLEPGDLAPGEAPPDDAVTYAHHPPLQVFVTVASVGLLGDNLAALRLAGFVIGAATVVFMAALLRGRGLEWGPILLATGTMAATGFFYIYGRLGVGFSLVVAAVAVVAHLRDAPNPSRKLLAAGAAVVALAAMQSWIAMGAVGLLVLWLWTVAGSKSAALRWVAAGALAGAAVVAVWLLSGAGPADLSAQVANRTDTSVGGFGDFLSRQWRFAGDFTPAWLRWLVAPALIAGLADRRTRMATAVTLAVAAAWTFGLRQGAWIHRLWNFPWLAPVTIGLAALADAARRLVRGRLALAAGAVAAALIAVTAFRMVTGPVRDAYLTDPAAAGSVLEAAGPDLNPDRDRFWVAGGIPTPRWGSYYLNVPVWTLTDNRFHYLAPTDLVLIRNDRPPVCSAESDPPRVCVADRIPAAPVDGEIAEGRYRLIPARALIEADPG